MKGPVKKRILISLGLAAAALGCLLLMERPRFLVSGHPVERSPSACLKALATAQTDFRSNDRDGNGINDFWRADVAGLFGLETNGVAIKLIDPLIAYADERPASNYPSLNESRNPKAGYLYRAIRQVDENKPDPLSRFAFCTFPASYPASGRMTFIIAEDAVVWGKDLGRSGGVEVFPADPAKEGWTRKD